MAVTILYSTSESHTLFPYHGSHDTFINPLISHIGSLLGKSQAAINHCQHRVFVNMHGKNKYALSENPDRNT